MKSLLLARAICLSALTALPAVAQSEKHDTKPDDKAVSSDAKSDAKKDTDKAADEPPVVTSHSILVHGAKLDYTAKAGRLALKTEAGKKRADMFYAAYTKNGVDDPTQRPIMFAFNGGPGSASVWLHVGTIGPRRVELSDDGLTAKPPYKLIDNQETWLTFADLVFIDPVTTGYSRAAEGENDDQFHGYREDIESVGDFIRTYATREQRWGSPKYLAGESYGTTRAAGLAEHLQERYGMYLNGVVLISAILNFQTAEFDRGNDLPYALFLPTYTATAWFHKQLEPQLQRDLRATLDEVEAFARGEYTIALMRGDKLPDADRTAIRKKLARYTGLSEAYIASTNERIEIQRFTKELLRDERRTVGRLDSRFRGIDFDSAGDGYEFDPSYAGILGPFTGVLHQYVRGELKFESDLPYEILTGRVRPWKFSNAENRYLNASEPLRQAMTQNPNLRVYVAEGYFDLATPYFAADYTVEHLGLDPSLRGNIEIGRYESGHMMYIERASRERLSQEIGKFVR